jgi:predicted nucleotidyltransferase
MQASFSEMQVDVLKALHEKLYDIDFVVVGACALQVQLGDIYRQTQDLDITLAVDLNELKSVFERFSDWAPDTRIEHRIRTPDGMKIDLLPAGESIQRAGSLTWPDSGITMNMLGFRLAFEHRVLVEISSELEVPVAEVSVVAFLKMISFMDRPHERERDLQDLMTILETYLAPDDLRRWDDDIFSHNPDYDTASAYCLGKDLGDILNEREGSELHRFLDLLGDDTDSSGIPAIASRMASRSWSVNPDQQLVRCLSALKKGFLISRPVIKNQDGAGHANEKTPPG